MYLNNLLCVRITNLIKLDLVQRMLKPGFAGTGCNLQPGAYHPCTGLVIVEI